VSLSLSATAWHLALLKVISSEGKTHLFGSNACIPE